MTNVELARNGRTARLWLNRPEVLNALSPDLLGELVTVCEELQQDDTTHVVVLEGAGEHFSAGGDLPAFLDGLKTTPAETADIGRAAAAAIAALPQITVAAIRGVCIGGGIVLSGACDMRVAAANSRFSIPELDVGIPLLWGGMHAVVKLLGETVANDLVLTARKFDAEYAAQVGFVSRVFADESFASDVEALVNKIADRPTIVLRKTKQQLAEIRDGSFDARDDAARMIEALDNAEASAAMTEYIRKHLQR